MSRHRDEEVLMRNYLLGDLDEGTLEQIEERLLCDDNFAERLAAAQDHLIDDYVFDALSESERESFEKNFLFTDERRRKMIFAQALGTYVDERYGQQPLPLDDSHLPSPSWSKPLLFLRAHKAWSAFSLAILLLLVFLTPKIVRWFEPTDRGDFFRAQRANIERRVAEVNRRPTDPRIQALPAYELALQPALLRDEGGIKRVILTEDIKLLTLMLALPHVQHESYRALVLTVEGEELFAVDGLMPESGAGATAIPLKIPSEFLPTGDYQIQLRGAAADGRAEDATRYNFRIINRK